MIPEEYDIDKFSESSLILAVRSGDLVVFERLFRKYYQPLWRFANRYVLSMETAEDIVQDVFSSIWANRETWDVADDVKSYLYRAVRNRTINHHKRMKLENRVFDFSATLHGDVPSGESDAQEKLEAGSAKELVYSLSEPRRTAVILRYYEGLKFSEIASVLGTSTKSAEMLVARAIRSLRNKI